MSTVWLFFVVAMLSYDEVYIMCIWFHLYFLCIVCKQILMWYIYNIFFKYQFTSFSFKLMHYSNYDWAIFPSFIYFLSWIFQTTFTLLVAKVLYYVSDGNMDTISGYFDNRLPPTHCTTYSPSYFIILIKRSILFSSLLLRVLAGFLQN